MKSIQLMSLVVLLALVPASAQAQNSGRKYGTYQGGAASSNPSNYGSEKAVPVTAPAVATGVAAPAAVTPGTPVAATTPVNTPAAAAPVATPVVGTPQTVPPVFQDTTGAGAAPATAAAATPAAPPDACAGYMYDNNAYQSCKDMMLKIERMKAGSKARNASYQAQAPATTPAPAVAAPVAAVPVAAATPTEPATATTPDAATPATPATAPIMIIPGATKPVTPVQ